MCASPVLLRWDNTGVAGPSLEGDATVDEGADLLSRPVEEGADVVDRVLVERKREGLEEEQGRWTERNRGRYVAGGTRGRLAANSLPTNLDHWSHHL